MDLPNLYKKSIVFFRSLHSLVRLLPAFQLQDRLKGSDCGMTLGYRLRKNHVQRFDEIPYGMLNNEIQPWNETYTNFFSTEDTPLTSTSSSESEHFEFADILTPIG